MVSQDDWVTTNGLAGQVVRLTAERDRYRTALERLHCGLDGLAGYDETLLPLLAIAHEALGLA